MDNLSSTYTELATKYENGTGGATREIAKECVDAALSITSDSVVHDNACGPAIVTSVVMSQGARPSIYATDFAKGMVDVTRAFSQQNGWDNVHCQEMDGQHLAFADNFFTHSFSCLGVYLFPDSKKGVAEMYRTLQSNGFACFSSMKDPVWPAVALKVYQERFPNAEKSLQFPETPGWYHEADIQKTLREAGFQDIHVIEVPATFHYADEATGRATWHGMLTTFSTTLRELDQEMYDAFFAQFWKELLENHGTSMPDGKVQFTIRAWVSYGTK